MKSQPIALLVAASCALFVLAACSGSSDGGSSPDNPQPLAKLSVTHQQNFENWKRRVAKSCDAAEAFGLSNGRRLETVGIDGAALLASNGGSLIFTENENFAILTSTNSLSGVGTTKAQQTRQENGQTYTISAETKRSGSNCSLYLFGEKVYETSIARNFVIGVQWSAGKAAKLTSAAAPQVKPLGVAGVGEVVQHGVYHLISQTLRPSKEAIPMIARKLGMDEDQASKLFQVSESPLVTGAVRIAGQPSAVWSNQYSGNLIASVRTLKTAFDGNNRSVPLEVRLDLPKSTFGPMKNDADNGSLKLTLNLLISKKDTDFISSTQAVDLNGVMAFSNDEATACAKDRVFAYRGSAPGPSQIWPSVESMFGPCRSLDRDIEKTSFENGLMASLIPQVFAGIIPSKHAQQYGGWDQVLARLARKALNQNLSIRDELDPSSKATIVGLVADNLETLKLELSRTENMGPSEDSIFQMGLNWAFSGESVSPSRIRQILHAVDNSIDPFRLSAETLLIQLSRAPNDYDDQLRFSQSIDASYKAEALRAFALAKELDYSDFERDVFNLVIQKKISISDLQDWSTNLGGIKKEISGFSQLDPLKGELVGLSIKWLKSNEASLQDLAALYAAAGNAIHPFEESTRELLNSMRESPSDHKQSVAFARSLSAEYKQLAVAIHNNSLAAEFVSWGQAFFKSVLQKQPSLEQLRSWNELWAAALAFSQREKSRTQGELGSTHEWDRKKVLETALSENWSANDFIGLENIAEVAREKTSCGRHKGYSSLADCAGMRLFSKKKGMFLDPTFEGRYAAAGKDFSGYLSQLSGVEWTSLRRALVQEFFGSFEPIWSECDQAAFHQKASTLKSQVNALVRETSQVTKWEIERKIKDTLRACQ